MAISGRVARWTTGLGALGVLGAMAGSARAAGVGIDGVPRGGAKLVEAGGLLRPDWGARRAGDAEVELPVTADSPTAVTDPVSKLSVRFRPLGARPTPARVERGTAVFRGALDGHSLVSRPLPNGVEDYLALKPGSTLTSIRYVVELGNVAGLRLVGGALELLDSGGAPRLRVAPPYLSLPDGSSQPAELALEGCAADTSSAPPWGRPVVAPGARSCVVVVSWSAQAAALGALVDPAWTKTGDMAVRRRGHSATLLGDGRVFVVGESSGGTGSGTSSEIYDPKTGTWAMSGQTTQSIFKNTASWLGKDRLLVLTSSKAEIYDPKTGQFKAAPPLNPERLSAAVTPLADGSVLVAGGYNYAGGQTYLASAVRFDATTEQWVAAGTMTQTRAEHGATLLASGQVLVTGGRVFGTLLQTTELYDPASNAWSPAASMGTPHGSHVALRLADGRVAAHGGFKLGGDHLDIFDPSSGKWSAQPSSKYNRYYHAAVALSDGSLLTAGGQGNDGSTSLSDELASSEVWNPVSQQWVVGLPMLEARDMPTLTLLSDDGATAKILVAGGGPDTVGRHAEVLSGYLVGHSCSAGADCVNGTCVDGFCCDSTCSGPCLACSSALKGGGKDGQCGVVAAGTDPDGDCAEEPASTCGKTGSCDAAGACALHAQGTECQEGTCYTNYTTFLLGWKYQCDGLGECVKKESDCCYKDGEPVSYCSCYYGECQYSGTGGVSLGGAGGAPGGQGGGGGLGGAGAGGMSAGGGTASSSDAGGCGCRASQSPRGALGLVIGLLLWVMRRRQ